VEAAGGEGHSLLSGEGLRADDEPVLEEPGECLRQVRRVNMNSRGLLQAGAETTLRRKPYFRLPAAVQYRVRPLV